MLNNFFVFGRMVMKIVWLERRKDGTEEGLTVVARNGIMEFWRIFKHGQNFFKICTFWRVFLGVCNNVRWTCTLTRNKVSSFVFSTVYGMFR